MTKNPEITNNATKMTFTQLQTYAQSKNFTLSYSYSWTTPDGFPKANGYEIQCTVSKNSYVTCLPLNAALKEEIDDLSQKLEASGIKLKPLKPQKKPPA